MSLHNTNLQMLLKKSTICAHSFGWQHSWRKRIRTTSIWA